MPSTVIPHIVPPWKSLGQQHVRGRKTALHLRSRGAGAVMRCPERMHLGTEASSWPCLPLCSGGRAGETNGPAHRKSGKPPPCPLVSLLELHQVASILIPQGLLLPCWQTHLEAACNPGLVSQPPTQVGGLSGKCCRWEVQACGEPEVKPRDGRELARRPTLGQVQD